MHPSHRAVIHQNEARLIGLIKFDDILPHLVALNLFTKAMVDDFKALNDEERRTALIRDLPTRGPQAFQTFGQILLNTGQAEAAQLLGFTVLGGHTYNAHELVRNSVPEQNGLRRDSASIPLELIKETVQVFQGPEIYKMSSSPRGHCLLINNHDFSQSILENRDGTFVDGENIKRVFRELDFLIEEHTNLTADGMFGKIQQFSRKEIHKDMDASVVFLLTHGMGDSVYGVDGMKLPVKTVIRQFDSLNSPTLQGKPKLFFIQACRGDLVDYGTASTLQIDAITTSPTRIPVLRDILISYSCNEDYVAFRDTEQGSWYIRSLLEALTAHAHDRPLSEILQDMERKIQTFIGPQGEMTSTESKGIGFTKSLYFNPGYVI